MQKQERITSIWWTECSGYSLNRTGSNCTDAAGQLVAFVFWGYILAEAHDLYSTEIVGTHCAHPLNDPKNRWSGHNLPMGVVDQGPLPDTETGVQEIT